MPGRARITLAAVAVLGATTAVAAYAADGNVPQFTSLTATPKRFCAKSSSSCARTGTTLRFTLTTAAKVICDVRPRTHNIWGHREFTRKFPAGTSSVRIDDHRLTTGRWTIHVQGVSSVGAGPPDRITVRVIK